MNEAKRSEESSDEGANLTVLLCCPFCGRVEFDMIDTLYPSGLTWVFIECEQIKSYGHHGQYPNRCWKISCDCGAELHGDSREETIEQWNTRAT